MNFIVTIMEAITHIQSKRRKKKFIKLLRRMDDDAVLTVWLICRLTCHFLDDKALKEITDIVQNEVYAIEDPELQDLYIGIVENFGVNNVLNPWFVLHEFLLYSFDRNEEGQDGLTRRIKGGNLRYYLNFSVFPLMSEEMRELITEDDINYVIELVKPLAKY